MHFEGAKSKGKLILRIVAYMTRPPTSLSDSLVPLTSSRFLQEDGGNLKS